MSLYTLVVPMLDELHGVLKRDKFALAVRTRGIDISDLFQGYAALCKIVTPATIAEVIHADSTDDMILATALAAQADVIVTRDNAILNVKRYHGMDILKAADALALITSSRGRGQ